MKITKETVVSVFDKYRHGLLFIFWPIFGLAFYIYEQLLPLTFNTVWCPIDDYIPFNELFIVPYYLWYAYMFGMLVFLFFKNPPEFKRYMWFIIIGYTSTMIFYLIYPTQQLLRPETFDRDNIFTQLVANLYSTDTNTNVCPSIHVIGQMAAFFAAWRNPLVNRTAWSVFWVLSTVLVCAATVFLKQHSFVDVVAGFAVSVAVYFAVYHGDKLLNRIKRKNK